VAVAVLPPGALISYRSWSSQFQRLAFAVYSILHLDFGTFHRLEESPYILPRWFVSLRSIPLLYVSMSNPF